MHFEKCIKEKEEVPRILHIWVVYLENYTEYSIQRIHLNNNKEYIKLEI